MPHDVISAVLSSNEDADDLAASQQSSKQSILSLMKEAGRGLVASLKQRTARGAFSAMMLAGAAMGLADRMDAQSMTAIVKGTVTSGTDTSGIFGAPGGNLAGQSFTLTYSFDDTKGTQVVSTSGSTPNGSYIETSGSSNPGTAVLEIGSGQWNFGGSGSYTASSINSEAQTTIEPHPYSYQYLLVTDYYNVSGSTGNDNVKIGL